MKLKIHNQSKNKFKMSTKLILIIFVSGLISVSGQTGRTANTNQRTIPQQGSSTFRNNMTSSLSPSATVQRQASALPQSAEWRTMSLQEKRDAVSNMSPKDRAVFLQQMKENIVMDDLDIPDDKEEAFKNLYSEYQNSQRQIKEKFFVDKNLENLSDEEAAKRLSQSFEVGQQLLDNRKAYAEKFLKILSPKQVLKLFQTEGKVRDKMLDKKNGSR